MHTVAMRTEATMPEEEPPANLGRAFKVVPLVFFSHSRESWMVMYLAWNIDCDYVYEQETFILAYPSLAWQLSACNHGEVLIWYSLSDLFTWGEDQTHMSEMFAFHATLMSNTLGTSILVFTRTGFMALLLSHYRPAGTIFAFTNEYVLLSTVPEMHCLWRESIGISWIIHAILCFYMTWVCNEVFVIWQALHLIENFFKCGLRLLSCGDIQ